MSFLLDTMVVSESSKPTRRRHPDASAWLDRTDDAALFIAAVTVGELRRGVELKRRSDAAAAERLDHWLGELLELFVGRVLPVDLRVAQTWGRLAARSGVLLVDTYLAAVAIANDLTIVTRNVRDFASLGVPVLNPYEAP